MPNNDALLRSPSIDDRLVYDAVAGKYAFPALAMSVEIGLYVELARQALGLEETADHFGLSQRAAEALVSVLAAMGFLEDGDGTHVTLLGTRGHLSPTRVGELHRWQLASFASDRSWTIFRRLAIQSNFSGVSAARTPPAVRRNP